ncbi:MAG: alanyl-tRNA editing protein [Pseudomonadota bacterium]
MSASSNTGTEPLFQKDTYAREAEATVLAVAARESGSAVICNRSIFYAMGGGQPGDTGFLRWTGGEAAVLDTLKSKETEGAIELLLAPDAAVPAVGETVTQALDWDRRMKHMRMHTALHLLSVVLPMPVTGGSIGAEKSRLDFDMPEAPEDKAAVEAQLNALIAGDHPVSTEWITDEELEANPGLVKTMAVKPPMGHGRVRLVRIGEGGATVDLQPCGGTHVARTGEIGRIALGKIEKKGKQNRRVSILFG